MHKEDARFPETGSLRLTFERIKIPFGFEGEKCSCYAWWGTFSQLYPTLLSLSSLTPQKYTFLEGFTLSSAVPFFLGLELFLSIHL